MPTGDSKDPDVTLSLATVPDFDDLTDNDSEIDEYSTIIEVEVEDQLLCSLLWAPAETAKRAVEALTSADFHQPVNAALFTAISELVEAGKPHNSAHVFTTLQQEGRTSGHLGKQLTKALADITTIGVPSAELEHNIAAVLTQAYRRGFREAARSLAQAAEELPEDQLFEHLLSIGRERRAASQRLAAHPRRPTMTDTQSQPKHRARSTHFIANIAFGFLYLALAVFVLTVAITGTTDGPVLAVLAGTGLAALAFHYFIAARRLRHTPSVKGEHQ